MQRYTHKYRVLVTRAREGMIMWVPPGEPGDPARRPEFYDATAAYLKDCGVQEVA